MRIPIARIVCPSSGHCAAGTVPAAANAIASGRCVVRAAITVGVAAAARGSALVSRIAVRTAVVRGAGGAAVAGDVGRVQQGFQYAVALEVLPDRRGAGQYSRVCSAGTQARVLLRSLPGYIRECILSMCAAEAGSLNRSV